MSEVDFELEKIVFTKSSEGVSIPDLADIPLGMLVIDPENNIIYAKNSSSNEVEAINFDIDKLYELINTLSRKKVLIERDRFLSSNDFTDELKKKLRLIEDSAEKNLASSDNRFNPYLEAVFLAKGMRDHILSDDHDARYPSKDETLDFYEVLKKRFLFSETELEVTLNENSMLIKPSNGYGDSLELASEFIAGLVGDKDILKIRCADDDAEANYFLAGSAVDRSDQALDVRALHAHSISDDHDDRYMPRDEVRSLLSLPKSNEPIIVRRPSVLYPYQDEYHVSFRPYLEGGEYSNLYDIPRLYREFEIDLENGDFSSPVYHIRENCNSIYANVELLPETRYKWRCRDVAADGEESGWSGDFYFRVNTYSSIPEAPESINVEGHPNSVSRTPVISVLETDSLNPNPLAIHWRIEQVGSTIFEVITDIGETSFEVPARFLNRNSHYTLHVNYEYEGKILSKTRSLSFSTSSSFFNLYLDYDDLDYRKYTGIPFGGGFFTGVLLIVEDKRYALVVAPKSQGGDSSKRLDWKTFDGLSFSVNSVNDGRHNLKHTIFASIDFYPAAKFCNELDINAYTDWHLPSRDELEICYRSFKPTSESNYTEKWGDRPEGSGKNGNSFPVGMPYSADYPAQTSISEFKEGGMESFRVDADSIYASSTQTDEGKVWVQSFRTGAQYHVDISDPDKEYWVRAVRWVEV